MAGYKRRAERARYIRGRKIGEHAAPLFTPAPERVAGIYRRDFSAKTKTARFISRNNKARRHELNRTGN
jgi:hypothetical protein